MQNQDAPRPSERVTLFHLTVFIVLAVLFLMLGQIIAKQSGLEKRISGAEQKIDRLENWMMTNGQVSAQRHTELMRILTTLSANSDFITSYYRRAEAEAGRGK